MAAKKEVIVVGGGLAGLAATMRLAEQGIHVKLVCMTKVKRSHSVCAQGGINAALNLHGEGDSPLIHAYETIKGGDFLADQPAVVEMCLSAPGIIRVMDRLGCPFNRIADGTLDVRKFGGSLYSRTVFCGASTGQQLLYTLDEQVRRYEVKGLVEKYENHEFMRLCRDSQGRARGICMMDHFNLKLSTIKADAVVIATGGLGVIFKKSTNSIFCSGAANGRLYLQGMKYANGEFIQIHPTAIVGEDKMRLMSESARGEGGRLWVWGDSNKRYLSVDGREVSCGETGKPWYFLEELYPAFGNLIPRDIAVREILRICQSGFGVDGGNQIYLDVTKISVESKKKIASILEIYEKFVGEDPREVPMKIFPAVHYSMGGAWVDWPASEDSDRMERFRQMTSIPGCFNVGESDFGYHGANRLGANSLLSCIFGGLTTGLEVARYLVSCPEGSGDFEEALRIEERRREEIMSRNGPENIHKLHDELADWMVKYVTVERNNSDLKKTINKIKEIRERAKRIKLDDTSRFLNQTYIFANQFEAMLEIAHVITTCALLRDESRGSHYKAEFPQRDDANWLKTTIAEWDPETKEPRVSYVKVDTRYVEPEYRDYKKWERKIPHFNNLPVEIPLPV
ncbi:MAG: succinate dehydrogenase flavoprotein subunit [Verrucomicrobia bacterium]|nr:succinate dehydrogenase flavoprotein subunit [Verrucomicrobiota bacterium]